MSHESISKAASTATYTGASLSASSAAAAAALPPGVQDTVLGLTLNQWTVAGIMVGMATAIAGLLVNVYFQRQRNKLMAADGD